METTKSGDGTVIAYDRAGDGPALIAVTGAFCDRQSFVPPDSLTAAFTVYTYDRRGRGDSGDTEPYSPDREVEDLAAVIGAAGGSAFCFGHSSGAALVLRAAAQGAPVTAAVVYEAPYIIPGSREVPADPAARIRELVASGRRDDAVRFWMTEVIQVPARVVTMMERSPTWPGLAALTHTLPYDLALTGNQGVPAAELARITVPVLVMGGGNSPEWFGRTVRETTAAIPGARLQMMAGYDHGIPPEVLAPVLTGFFLGSGS
jgi:pimeloyl-ACP methyl ester carboxylesterase